MIENHKTDVLMELKQEESEFAIVAVLVTITTQNQHQINNRNLAGSSFLCKIHK